LAHFFNPAAMPFVFQPLLSGCGRWPGFFSFPRRLGCLLDQGDQPHTRILTIFFLRAIAFRPDYQNARVCQPSAGYFL
jgi:hypothetical protein